MADVQLSTLGSVIKTAYEGESNTNAFTDTEKTKLSGVATGADVSPVTSVAGEVGVISAADMTAALNAFTTSLKGLAPASGGGTTNFLRADGTWAAPPGASGGDAWGDAVDADVVPDGDGTRDLGSSANRFANLHVDSIDLNGNTFAGATLTAPAQDGGMGYDFSASANKYWGAGTGLSFDASFNLNAEVSLAGSETLTNKTLTDPKITLTVNAQTGTTYTLVLADAHKKVTMSNASANTLTIPTNASVAYPTGTVLGVSMIGAGTTTVTGDTGVTVNGVSAGGADISAQYTGVTLTKIGTDAWLMEGNHGTVA